MIDISLHFAETFSGRYRFTSLRKTVTSYTLRRRTRRSLPISTLISCSTSRWRGNSTRSGVVFKWLRMRVHSRYCSDPRRSNRYTIIYMQSTLSSLQELHYTVHTDVILKHSCSLFAVAKYLTLLNWKQPLSTRAVTLSIAKQCVTFGAWLTPYRLKVNGGSFNSLPAVIVYRSAASRD